MKDIIIVGAGGVGREVLYLIKNINKIEEKWNIKGFIDDNLNALDNVKCEYSVIGTISKWNPSDNEVFAIGIASPRTKEKITNILKIKNALFVSLISPSAKISEFVSLGDGCIITGGAFIGDCAKIGNFVNISGAMIGQDSIIDDYSTVTGYANIVSAKIGKRVFVGSHSVVLNGRKIGDDAFICAGSIVFNHVKPLTKVFGNPAKKANF